MTLEKQLADRLERLGAMPDMSGVIASAHKEAIARDAARQACDDRIVWIDKTNLDGDYKYEVRADWERGAVLFAATYEEALIAGLDWVIERREAVDA